MIFLSHNYKDKPVVRQIAQTLESVYGQENVFYDEWSIQPGDSIIENMNNGLEKCRYFFFFVSKNSLASNMVRLEWQAALMKINSSLKFIPVRLDNSIMPAIIAPTLYIDLYTYGLNVAQRQIVDVINGVNTYQRVNEFSNLVANISQYEDKTEIEITATYYMEPQSRYLILVDNQESDLIWKVPNFSSYESGFYKNIQFTNGIHNCLLIAVNPATSPGFPVNVVLEPKNNTTIKVLYVMHAISRTDFSSIPIKWKGNLND